MCSHRSPEGGAFAYLRGALGMDGHGYNGWPYSPVGGCAQMWERIFALLARAGAERHGPFPRGLGWREWALACVNPFALLLGPWYYFYKGMFLKGGLYMGLSMIFWALCDLALPGGAEGAASWLPGLAMALLANYDYYLFRCHGIRTVRSAPALLGTGAGVAAVLALGFLLRLLTH
ncbi:MAG: hypothetical protein K6A65_06715 [Succinivibrionaceae bacterium]|nr:hypothetical protein [Succinivibrionaceae bacterium]